MERKKIGSENGKKQSDEIDKYFKKIYYDTRNSASYSGIGKLYRYVKKLGKKQISKN